MKPMTLADLTPEGASFSLEKTGKTYNMRPFNLRDEKWLGEVFGAELSVILKEVRMLQIARIVYHQLEEESKKDFAQQEITVINELGVETKDKIGGAELLFVSIVGWHEKMEMLKALMQTIGISRKIQDAEFDKEKKSLANPPIGPSSSTDSRMNTDGAQNISGAEHSEKSTGDLTP